MIHCDEKNDVIHMTNSKNEKPVTKSNKFFFISTCLQYITFAFFRVGTWT